MTFVETFLEYVKSYIKKNEKKYITITAECQNWQTMIDNQLESGFLVMKSKILIATKKGVANILENMRFEIWLDEAFTSYEDVAAYAKKRIAERIFEEFDATKFQINDLDANNKFAFYNGYDDRFMHMRKMTYSHLVKISWRFDLSTGS